ncbi:hypothetical protein BC831DRAFT_397109, partial [Entophlyctis helioformis]
AHDKYQVVAGVPRMARGGSPLKPLCSASYFLQITTTWDRGNRAVREKILREFVSSNEKKTGPQLEKEFSNGASLFLTRISAWLRLTQIDKAEALRLLLNVANNGRKYKEFVCESFAGVRQVTECLSKSRSEVTQDYARNLLIELGTGNPKFQMQVFKGLQSLLTSQAVSPTAQQMSGQALRTLLPSISTVPAGFIDPTMSLLKSPHIQVQYEGYEILRELVTRTALQDPILLQLISILRNIVDDGSDDTNDSDRHRRNKMDQKGLVGQWTGMSSEEQKEKDLITSGYVQQAYAAKLLGIMAASSKDLAERMIQFQLVSGLLNVIANVGHPDSQRYAASTLLYLVENFDYVAYALRDHMGSNFFELIEMRPDTFYRELNKEQVRYLRRNTVKIKKADSHPSLSDSADSGSESSDDETGQKPGHGGKSKKDAMAFPSTSTPKESKPTETAISAEIEAKVHQQAILDTYEKKDEDQEEAPLVDSVYTPFVQTNAKTTFAGNKYVVGASPNEGAKKFTNDLEKFRNTTLKHKKREGKKEFDVVMPQEIQSRLVNMKTDVKLFSKEMAMSGDIERKRVPMPRPKTLEGSAKSGRGSILAPSGRPSAMTKLPDGDAQGGAGPQLAAPRDSKDDASSINAEDLELSPEEQEERRKILELAAKNQQDLDSVPGIVIDEASWKRHAYSSGDAASYRPSVMSNASDADTELIGSERDFGVSVALSDSQRKLHQDGRQSVRSSVVATADVGDSDPAMYEQRSSDGDGSQPNQSGTDGSGSGSVGVRDDENDVHSSGEIMEELEQQDDE